MSGEGGDIGTPVLTDATATMTDTTNTTITSTTAIQSSSKYSYGSIQQSIHNYDEPTNNLDTDNDEESFLDPSLHTHPNHKGTITMLGSIAIIANSLTGPAMVNLPSTFQKSGLIPTISTIILLGYLSSVGSLHMANVISKVPGNASFTKEIEFSESFRLFWGQSAFVVTQIIYFGCITCLNIASIVDTAQVVDQILSKRFGTWAIKCTSHSLPSLMEPNPQAWANADFMDGNLTTSTKDPSQFSWKIYRGNCKWVEWNATACSQTDMVDMDECIPFSDEYDEAMETNTAMMLLTVGYVLSAIVFIPMSLKDLKENTPYQILSFVILLVLSVQFVGSFLVNGIDLSNVSLWGYEWKNLFGVVLFNFAAVIAIPAWLYEKKPSVSVNRAINDSTVISCTMYILIGALGALTMPNVSDNMLQSMMSGSFGKTTEITSEFFCFFIIGFGIPLFSVLSRLNLVGSGLCSETVANILSIYLPWLVSWIFYTGEKVSALLGWGGVIFTSIIVFLAPLLLALHVRMEYNTDGSVPVYGGCCASKPSQIAVLVLFILASVLSIVLALIGEIMD